MVKRDRAPGHQGEILVEDFLKPMGITQYRLAKFIGVSQRRFGQIVAGQRAITADTALRPARFFGTKMGFYFLLFSEVNYLDKLNSVHIMSAVHP